MKMTVLRPLVRAITPVKRIGARQIVRAASRGPAYQSPAPDGKSNSHRDFYKQFGLPIVKVFLGALFTYQVTYFLWLKLESFETTKEGDAEIARLEEKLESVKKTK